MKPKSNPSEISFKQILTSLCVKSNMDIHQKLLLFINSEICTEKKKSKAFIPGETGADNVDYGAYIQ